MEKFEISVEIQNLVRYTYYRYTYYQASVFWYFSQNTKIAYFGMFFEVILVYFGIFSENRGKPMENFKIFAFYTDFAKNLYIPF